MSLSALRFNPSSGYPKQLPGPNAELNTASLIAEQSENLSKAENDQYSSVPLQSGLRHSSDTFSNDSLCSVDNENEPRTGRLVAVSDGLRLTPRSPAPLLT